MKNVAIVLLLIAIIAWFAMAIVRLENERYAMELGMCGNFDSRHPEMIGARRGCLDRVQTRTSPIYNLLYGLKLV